MPVSCDVNASPSAPDHGDTITVIYSVDGNDPIDPTSATITGRVVVGGTAYDVSTAVTLPGTPADSVVYDVPACPDLPGFVSTSDPATFTTTVP
jgi:hypothetical protein